MTVIPSHHRVGCGVEITGNGALVELVVKKIEGRGRDKSVKFDVRGLEGRTSMELGSPKRTVDLMDGFRVSITRQDRSKGREVSIVYNFVSGYHIEFRTFY